MARHHYVPQFLLREWATSGRFVAHFWSDDAKKLLINNKALVASACQIDDLNTFFGVKKEDKDAPETQFFTPIVDTPAALAHQTMLTDAINGLTAAQRLDWARLLVSFAVRTPETLREMGPRETKAAFERIEALAKGPVEDEQRVTEIVNKNMPTFQRNFPLGIAIELSSDPDKLNQVAGMHWWLRKWDRPTLLIGDRPLLATPRMKYPCGIPLDNPNCAIAIPLSPKTLFLASTNKKTQATMRTMQPGLIARTVNDDMILQSHCVYFPNDSLADDIGPKISGKASKTWPQAPKAD